MCTGEYGKVLLSRDPEARIGFIFRNLLPTPKETSRADLDQSFETGFYHTGRLDVVKIKRLAGPVH